MGELKPEETQHELFQEFSKESKKPDRFPSLGHTQKPILLTTSIEQIILCGIVLILLCCFVFFLGVLRGRTILKTAPATPPTTQQMAVSRPQAQTLPAVPVRGAVSAPSPVVITHTPAANATVAAAYGAFPKPDLSKPYTLQLVTFKTDSLAQAEAAQWRKKGYFASVIQKGNYYLVCIGEYANKTEAQKDLKFFSKKYKDCFLRRR